MKRHGHPFLLLFALWCFSALFVQAQHLVNTPTAVGILGQSDFVSKVSGKGANRFNGPNGVTVDPVSGKVFIADRGNHRVLRWTSMAALSNGSSAEAVFGQPDFETVSAGVSATKMDNPIGVQVDQAGRLWVCDFSNNRVLRFDSAASKATGAPADGVLGQADFASKVSVTSQSTMRGPVVSFLDHEGRLWVTEFNAHRVTRYDSAATKPNGAPANGVLGQPDFTTAASALTASGMSSPNGLYVDSAGRLWVSETGNRRVTRFDQAASKPNGAAADGVLGQPNFTTNTANTTRNGFSSLRFVTGDSAGRIYVIQEGTHRIVVFNDGANKPNGADADFIWGQPDFTTGTAANPPTAQSYNTPRAMTIDETGGNVWVADWANHRVLRYGMTQAGQPSLTLTAPAAGAKWGQNTTQKIQWTSAEVEQIGIDFSANNGAEWIALDTVAASAGAYAWSVNSPLTTQALIRLRNLADSTLQSISGPFEIVPAQFSVTLISPNGYQEWETGATRNILFNALNVSHVQIDASYDNGVTWQPLEAAFPAASEKYAWTIGPTLSEEALIRISDTANPEIKGISAHTFRIVAPRTGGEQDYVFFSDSPTPGFYDPSFGFANAPSTLKRVGDKLPVSANYSLVGNYAIELGWSSQTGGDWGAAIAGIGWVGRDLTLKDTLSIKAFSENGLSSQQIPFIYVEDLSNRKSAKVDLSAYAPEIGAKAWKEIRIPLQVFKDNPGSADLTRIKTIFFGQRLADTLSQTLYLDDIRVSGKPITSDSMRVYVVLGSSTAAGTGATTADSSWVGRFRTYVKSLDPEALVINLAVGGYTTYDIMPSSFTPPSGRPAPKTNNNITQALSYKPTAILINLPSNDAAQGFTNQEQLTNFQTVVGLIQQAKIPFRVTTTQPRNLSAAGIQSLQAIRDSLLAAYGENAVNVYDEMASATGGLKPAYDIGDGIHVNNSGHKYIFDQIIGSGILKDLLSTGIKDLRQETALLDSLWPNPVSETLAIRYRVPESGLVRLGIYDVQGRLVQTLVQTQQAAGSYQAEWHTQGVQPGMYFCAMTFSGKQFARETAVVVVAR
ncbi:MAG: T9SS type A sorting domain-containing protein [Haliscomenobacter sp.]|nr:T9SS type A sorting domain-containing protein [Haliscomenobacter sp.]